MGANYFFRRKIFFRRNSELLQKNKGALSIAKNNLGPKQFLLIVPRCFLFSSSYLCFCSVIATDFLVNV